MQDSYIDALSLFKYVKEYTPIHNGGFRCVLCDGAVNVGTPQTEEMDGWSRRVQVLQCSCHSIQIALDEDLLRGLDGKLEGLGMLAFNSEVMHGIFKAERWEFTCTSTD